MIHIFFLKLREFKDVEYCHDEKMSIHNLQLEIKNIIELLFFSSPYECRSNSDMKDIFDLIHS